MIDKKVELPFLSMSDGKLVAWTPVRTGTFAEQCARGAAYADQAIDGLRHDQNLPTMVRIIRLVCESDAYGGVEVGFMSRLSAVLLT